MVCPACDYTFADIQKTLPVVRDSTQEFGPRTLSEKAGERLSGPPKHVVVPLLAGLLVAIAVIVVVRISSSDYQQTDNRSGQAESGSQDRARPLSRLSSPGDTVVAADRSLAMRSTQNEAGTMPSLGPGTSRQLPIDIGFTGNEKGDNEEDGNEVLALVDGSSDTCLYAGAPGHELLEFTFATPHRFSHIHFHIGCVAPQDSEDSLPRMKILCDDGSSRDVPVPNVQGPVWVDLAGAWSSRIILDMSHPGFQSVGLGEVEFFVFEK